MTSTRQNKNTAIEATASQIVFASTLTSRFARMFFWRCWSQCPSAMHRAVSARTRFRTRMVQHLVEAAARPMEMYRATRCLVAAARNYPETTQFEPPSFTIQNYLGTAEFRTATVQNYIQTTEFETTKPHTSKLP